MSVTGLNDHNGINTSVPQTTNCTVKPVLIGGAFNGLASANSQEPPELYEALSALHHRLTGYRTDRTGGMEKVALFRGVDA